MNRKERLAILEERIARYDERRKDQALEYERRLSELNHAHEKQVADQATYVSLDKFEAVDARVQALERGGAGLAGTRAGILSSRELLFAVLGLAGTLAAILWG